MSEELVELLEWVEETLALCEGECWEGKIEDGFNYTRGRYLMDRFKAATNPNREAVSRPSTEDSGLSIESLGAEGGSPE